MHSPQHDVASTSNPDVLVNNVGTLYTFCPLTLRAKEWIDEHVQDDAQWFGYALRRRFAFVDLEPRFDHPKFDATLAKNNISAMMRERIKSRIKDLNSRISSDRRNLGHGFEIGHSFFCPKSPVHDEEKWFESVIKYEIRPLLMEYRFDDQEKAHREVDRLLGENPD